MTMRRMRRVSCVRGLSRRGKSREVRSWSSLMNLPMNKSTSFMWGTDDIESCSVSQNTQSIKIINLSSVL